MKIQSTIIYGAMLSIASVYALPIGGPDQTLPVMNIKEAASSEPEAVVFGGNGLISALKLQEKEASAEPGAVVYGGEKPRPVMKTDHVAISVDASRFEAID